MRQRKYRNKQLIVGGEKYDSKLEYYRGLLLLDAERQGRIRNLRRQVDYEVIPRQTEMVEVQLKTKTKMVERVLERNCEYRADFVYEVRDGDSWREVIEDTKSEETRKLPDYVMKRKLMRLQGHPIREVLKASETI